MGGKILNYEAKEILNRGRQEGIKEGRKEERLDLLRSLVDDGLLALSEAAKRAGISEQEFSQSMMKFA